MIINLKCHAVKCLITAIILICKLFPVSAQSFEGSGLGKGLSFTPKDSSFAMQMNVRFQTLYEGFYTLDSENYNDEMTIRRFRIKFNGFLFDPRLTYKIGLALSNRDQKTDTPKNGENMVLDAVIKYKMSRGWQIWAGQTKLPGNRERIISSGSMQFVDRSNLDSKFSINRGIGFQVHHEHSLGNVVLRESGAVTMGDGRNVINENIGGYDYTIRGEILPFGKFKNKGEYSGADLMRESTPKLAVGVTYDYIDGASNSKGQIGNALGIKNTLSNYVIDAMFKYKGFSFMGEYVNKWVTDKNSRYAILNSDEPTIRTYFYTGKALNLQAGYVFPSNYEIAGRYTTTKPDQFTDGRVDYDNDRYSLGLSKYISGHTVKIQSTITYVDFEAANNSNDGLEFQLQMEIGF